MEWTIERGSLQMLTPVCGRAGAFAATFSSFELLFLRKTGRIFQNISTTYRTAVLGPSLGHP